MTHPATKRKTETLYKFHYQNLQNYGGWYPCDNLHKHAMRLARIERPYVDLENPNDPIYTMTPMERYVRAERILGNVIHKKRYSQLPPIPLPNLFV